MKKGSDEREVRVRVLFFGAAREAAADEAVLTLAPGATARSAFARVLEEYPDLGRFRSALLVAVNQEYVRDLNVELEDGDESSTDERSEADQQMTDAFRAFAPPEDDDD